jgi:hypothetical protein
MNSKNEVTSLTGVDEYLHNPTNELKWRESYYFNWVDLKNRISGFSTIGIVPNEYRREFVFLLFTDEKNEVYYKEPPLLKFEENIDIMLKEKRLSFRLVKPFKHWEIEYNSHKLHFKINFKVRFPTYYFGLDSSASWHQHFEASGKIDGILKFKDHAPIKINGFGQRDKSWGYRDWHQFDKWYAGHFQFKNWSCTFRNDYYNDMIDLSGHISSKHGNTPISALKIETVVDDDKFKSPLRTLYSIKDINGDSFKISASRIKKDSFIRFARDFPGGFTELFEQMVIMKNEETGDVGSGMMEHLRTVKSKS